ncbi:protocatechuate 3,4-dioxygenase subunit alpha [Gryllotalpicola ginsengisoli]|uniref:protocatechuate 3,4-dioxygenase subunit alpha n=1 Tax=Gryllotalpicola ginsengisoli TaxID=444608 RepID=UPI0003B43E32|nr:protocatechuate 3,4-dioxygenase subunit alpha [Gryllotalpicola ginsengisoli]
MSRLPRTPGQTVGPFFHYGTEWPRMNEVVAPFSPGSVLLEGVVYDGAGEPVPDVMLEIWSADSDGTIPTAPGVIGRDGHTFTGFGRAHTRPDGHYEFWTREPGPVDERAPFYSMAVFARGLLDVLHTRVYLPDDAGLHTSDPFLAKLTDEERATVIATRTAEGSLRHDLRLQGDGETVFIRF